MKEKCSIIMDKFLELDKNDRIPLNLTCVLHFLVCKKCRTQVRLMTVANKVCAEPLKMPLSDNDRAIELLMKKIDSEYDSQTYHISMRRWIVSGIIMILAMLVFLFSRSFLSSEALDFAFFFIFSSVISAYCAIFVGSNMDFFIKKIETFKDSNFYKIMLDKV